ncbi:MAG: hypothetical protein IPL35_01875 [Sphingobacteriales bacterium]|nr:hypothetical protein [Sphingobacteriales bacterium]
MERLDSAELRLSKIKELIEASQYSIHDMSRAVANQRGEYFRLNMSFELGLDMGCRDYHSDKKYREKKILVLEQKHYDTQKALSDLAGCDCRCHEADAETLVFKVRNWFFDLKVIHSLSPASAIRSHYNDFTEKLIGQYGKYKFSAKDLDQMGVSEYLKYVDEFLKNLNINS